MIDKYPAEFAAFQDIHDRYAANPEALQTEFNEAGRKIQDIIRDYEDRLCGHSENSQFGKFSSSLADKFWELLRKDFPKIDCVGLISN